MKCMYNNREVTMEMCECCAVKCHIQAMVVVAERSKEKLAQIWY